MAIIKPFRSLRPAEGFAQQVASRPYDVLNSNEARLEATGNPHSFLHVTKAEIDCPVGIDIHSAPVYAKAKENLDQFLENGILTLEEKPCYYIYQLTREGKSQTGLVALSSVDDYFRNTIKKHEFTTPVKEKDRIDHMLAIRAQTGNVFLAYRGLTEINALLNGWKMANKPVYDFTTPDGVGHKAWVIDRDIVINSITQIFSTMIPSTFIADGHHRAASAAKVSQSLNGNEEAKYFLTTLFPANELTILEYNRLIKDLHHMHHEDLIGAVTEDFMITLSPIPVKPSRPHEFGMYLDGEWHILTARKGTYNIDPVSSLDISILSNNILRRILGIKDQRTDKRIEFVGGIRGLAELEKRVDSGEMKVAFSLYPVSVEQLFMVAESGLTMPPKSTWFEPKLRDGLFTHLI